MIAFMRHLQCFIGIKCVIRQFLASQDLIVDMIFEWLEFLVEVQTEKTEKVPQKTEKPKNTEKTVHATANFKFGTGFFSVLFGLQPPKPSVFAPSPTPVKLVRKSMEVYVNITESCSSVTL